MNARIRRFIRPFAAVALLASVQRAFAEIDTPQAFRPLVDRSVRGVIDWTTVSIRLHVEVDAPALETVAPGLRRKYRETDAEFQERLREEQRALARRRAADLARERALPLLLTMRLNSELTVADLEIKDPAAALLGPKTTVRIALERWNSRPEGDSLEIDAIIPIWDGSSSSIGATLVTILGDRLVEPAETLTENHGRRRRLRPEETVIFDARKTAAVPAIFSRVVTESGRVIWSARAVERAFLHRTGCGRFGLLDADDVINTGASRGGLPALRVLPVSAVEDDTLATYVVSDADADAFLQDPRRLFMLTSGRVLFLLSPPEDDGP